MTQEERSQRSRAQVAGRRTGRSFAPGRPRHEHARHRRDRAGVSTRTVSRHFKDKEAIFLALLGVWPAIEDASLPIESRALDDGLPEASRTSAGPRARAWTGTGRTSP